MNLKEIICVLAIGMYAFTAQLVVHAFAMHWDMTGYDEITIHTTHHHTAESDTHHHGDNEACTCGTQDHKDHDMILCLNQSEWIVVDDPFLTQEIKVLQYITFVPTYPLSYSSEWDSLYSNHDPGRWDSISFAKFLNTHYWSIIMHC